MPQNQSPLSWGHININVTDLERSIAFYDKLGFREFLPSIPYLGLSRKAHKAVDPTVASALKLPPGGTGRACILQLDDGFPMLDLTEFSGPSAKRPLANGDLGLVRICLVSQDLDADVARLQSDGVEFLSSPVAGVGALADVAICKDPDGTLIELIQVHLERWGSVLG